MSAVVIRNNREASEEPPESPLHEDGTRFPYSMTFSAGEYIAYADSPAELLGVLVPDYEEMSAQDQQVARIRLAIRAQMAVQAAINANADPDLWDALSETEKEILNGSRVKQPSGWGDPADPLGDVWYSAIPLVLVDTAYAPYSEVDKPISGIADVLDPPNIAWLRPAEEWDFLESLDRVEWVRLFQATDI